MFELIALVGLVVMAVAVLTVAGLALKLVFKLLVLPFTVLGFLLKLGFGLVLAAIGLALLPLVALLVLAILPVLLVAGLCGVGVAAFCAT